MGWVPTREVKNAFHKFLLRDKQYILEAKGTNLFSNGANAGAGRAWQFTDPSRDGTWFPSVVLPRKKRRNKLGENCEGCTPGRACCYGAEQREGMPFGIKDSRGTREETGREGGPTELIWRR